ncbi:putative deleted in malignant brain tumors 1 protein-like [Apostichopus japonicus]|uniref:Putative deleted in malignant brain tumors 1 protein-like n=1 Tax=Stichopus japonicus TaxID=307972 RepID=A0A2G8K669_STIJA|nr:putative deleted in malignant brain tumors 1 protein-like [Apostichopus japonicus]
MKIFLTAIAILLACCACIPDFLASLTAHLALKTFGGTPSTWMDTLRLVYIAKLPACPCTLSQADKDQRFITSNSLIGYFHEGASNCFRAPSLLSHSLSGQQCCYGDDGRLRIGIEQNGGTADAYSPDGITNILKHIWYDVLPWVAFCDMGNATTCSTYYNYRPSDDCLEYYLL